MGQKPKNKGHTNFYECCDLTEKSISNTKYDSEQRTQKETLRTLRLLAVATKAASVAASSELVLLRSRKVALIRGQVALGKYDMSNFNSS